MKDLYTMLLRCATCAGENFESNDDKSYVKCTCCGRKYLGGYDELLEYNQDVKDEVLNEAKADARDYIQKSLRDALKGCKNIKLK